MVFKILNVFFLDSVNRSLYNDCFWAISWFINACRFSVLIFLHARCKSHFSVFYLGMARAVFEGTNMVNAKGSNGNYRSWYKDRNSCRTARKNLGFKKNRRSSGLEIARKCQISKSTVAWICDACRQRTCTANTTFTQKVPNQVFESCFQPLGVISLYLFTNWYCVKLFYVMRNELVPFCLRNSTVFGHGTHFKTLKSA